MPDRFLDIRQLAAVLGVGERAAQLGIKRCLRGRSYRGMDLTVAARHGQVGRDGIQYFILAESLPAELRDRAVELGFIDEDAAEPAPAAPAQTPAAFDTPPIGPRSAVAEERLSIIAPVLATLRGSPERATAIGDTAKRAGKGERTIRRWAALYEEHGAAGLRRNPPPKQRRVLVSRAFDQGIDLPADMVRDIAAQIDQHTKNLWRSRGPGVWRQVAREASDHLHGLCRDNGSALPDAELRALCRIGKHYVNVWDRRKHAKTWIFEHDAKKFHDLMPGIRRDKSLVERPLAVLVGDGTALDIRFLRPDGTEGKIWVIGWLDFYSNRFFGNLLLRRKGGGVTQQHIAMSLGCVASEFGWPEAIYVDRGAEYGFLNSIDGFVKVVKALPYNARAKPIEGIFRVLLQYFRHIPGFLGSDRFRKPTATVGRPTTPFEGSFHELVGAVERAIADYNASPQDGLGGRSPDQVWQSAIDDGWQPRRVEMPTFIEAFAKKTVRTVSQGQIRLGNRFLTCDSLLRRYDLEGERVEVYAPLADGFPASVYDPAGVFVGLLEDVEAYHPTDPAGALESARLKGVRRDGARDMASQTETVSLSPHQARFQALNPPPLGGPAGDIVPLAGERGRAVGARRGLPAPARGPAASAPSGETTAERQRSALAILRRAQMRPVNELGPARGDAPGHDHPSDLEDQDDRTGT